MHSEDITWTRGEFLLADVIDVLHAANWQRGGGKGPQPKPYPRPGLKPDTSQYGKTNRSPQEVAAFLAQFQPPATEV